ncbi:MAG: GNAT family N-acetyltransferase [Verrucomicrobiota bacterium]|jgi:ribosomal protein S18 acetylase RimI-like enzyme
MSVPAVMITEFKIGRFDEVLALMIRTPGAAVRHADSLEATARYLERNPGLSFVAETGGRIIGCARCGHDGPRGYLQRALVESAYRGRGIAHDLVTHGLDALEKLGILKTHTDAFVTNALAHQYWTRSGWNRRDDISRYSFNRSQNENA